MLTKTIQQTSTHTPPNGTKFKFFAKLLRPGLAYQGYRIKKWERQVEKLKTMIEQEKESGIWTFTKTSNYRELGDTLAKLGRREEAITAYRTYIEDLMSQYEPYFNVEIGGIKCDRKGILLITPDGMRRGSKEYAEYIDTYGYKCTVAGVIEQSKVRCRLIPDMYSADATKLMHKGKYAEAATLYKKQVKEYDMVGNMNVLCLPDAEFQATKRTVSYSDIDFVLDGIAGSVIFELNQTRTERRRVIAGIGKERAKIARKNSDAAQKKADECQESGAAQRIEEMPRIIPA
ncbi:MAG: hypothetical protein NTX79_02380 [Candidatus Micrarchaeota archaeon]|nr:hypothetical protein [Candidatus Micrarchaeota archaeon]